MKNRQAHVAVGAFSSEKKKTLEIIGYGADIIVSVKCFVQGRGYRILQTFGDEMVGNLRFYS
jgi:hypothetical protein